jgi:hypothetical protein
MAGSKKPEPSTAKQVMGVFNKRYAKDTKMPAKGAPPPKGKAAKKAC